MDRKVNVLYNLDLSLSAGRENFSKKIFPEYINVSKKSTYNYLFKNTVKSVTNELRLLQYQPIGGLITPILNKYNLMNKNSLFEGERASIGYLDISPKTIITSLSCYSKEINPLKIEKSCLDPKLLSLFIKHNFLNDRNDAFNFFLVKSRAQIFELVKLFIVSDKYIYAGESLTSFFNHLSNLDSGEYNIKSFKDEPFPIFIKRIGLDVPILENIDSDKWIFYKHNFESNKNEIQKDWGLLNEY